MKRETMKRKHDVYYIYCIYNKVTGKSYIGQRKCPKNKTPDTDGYMGSGVLLKKSKEKHGIENFEKYIKEVCGTKEEADFLEKRWIKFYRLGNYAEYNIADGGDGGNGGTFSDEARNKLIQRNKDPEFRKKTSEGIRRYYIEHPEKRSSYERTEEQKEAARQRQINRWENPEYRKHFSEARKGCKPPISKGSHRSEVEKRNISEGTRKAMQSKEVRENLSQKRKGKTWEEIYGLERAQNMRKKRSERIKNGTYFTQDGLQRLANQRKGKSWYNNGEKQILLMVGEEIPEGFVKGKIR